MTSPRSGAQESASSDAIGQGTPSWTLSGVGGQGSLTYSLAAQGSHGTAVVNANGSYTYTPVANYTGADSFQFKVTDTLGLSSVATVSVGVGTSGYSVAQSLHLTGAANQYLSQTPTVAGNQTTWTWSGWVNPSSVASHRPGPTYSRKIGADMPTTNSGAAK